MRATVAASPMAATATTIGVATTTRSTLIVPAAAGYKARLQAAAADGKSWKSMLAAAVAIAAAVAAGYKERLAADSAPVNY